MRLTHLAQLSVLTLLISLNVGCEQAPPLTYVPEETIEGWESDSPRNDYDWDVFIPLGFATTPPSIFGYFDQLDREQLQQASSAVQDQAFRSESVRPAGMQDETFVWFRRITETQSKVEPSITIDQDKSDPYVSLDVSFDGKHLFLARKSEIEVWDFASKELRRRLPSESPIVGVMACGTSNDIVVLSEASVTRISINDGQPKAACVIDVPPTDWDCSDDGTVIAFTSTDGRLSYLNEDLSQLRTCEMRLISSAVDVHPRGGWIVANSEAGPLRWHVGDKSFRCEVLGNSTDMGKLDFVVSELDADHFLKPTAAWTFVGGILKQPYDKGIFPYRRFSCWVQSVQECGIEDASWTLALCLSLKPDGRWQYEFRDVEFSSGDFSMPLYLDELPLSWSANKTGEIIALLFKDRIEVLQRQRWMDPIGTWTASKCRVLFEMGRVEQAELFAESLRKQSNLRLNRSGERMYGDCAEAVGDLWATLEKNADNKQLLDEMQQWYRKGSTFALMCSAAKHRRIAWNARGDGQMYMASPQAWDTFQTHIQMEERELLRLLEQSVPPEFAFSKRIFNLRDGGQPLLSAEPLLRRYVDLYPTGIDAHCNVCYYLLTESGGDNSQFRSYIAALTECYPDSISNLVYARLATQLFTYFDPPELKRILSLERMEQGFNAMIERDELGPDGIGAFWHMAQSLELKLELADEIATHHIERYPFFTQHYHRIDGNLDKLMSKIAPPEIAD